MNVAGLLINAGRVWPRATALSLVDEPVWTYGELLARASSLAGGLRASGLQPGDRVVLAMANTPAYYEVLFGCWIAGLCAAPVNCRLHPLEIAYAVGDCGARLCFTTEGFTEPLQKVLPSDCPVIEIGGPAHLALYSAPVEPASVEPTDPAWLFYTSGTTGRPKGAVHTHRTLMNLVLSFLADSGSVVSDSMLHLAPMSHASGLLGLAYISRGLNNVILPRFDTDDLTKALDAFGPGSFFAVPTVVRRLMEPGALAPSTIERIHTIFFGGAPMYVDDLKKAIGIFGVQRLWHLYGQGEAPNTITHLPPRLFGDYDARLASVGIPRSGVSMRVVDGEGRELPPGETGEVVVQGDVLMGGYWNNPAATAAAIRNGWLHTGDLGRLDQRGFLTLVDRSKDVIIAGGSNIYPREIEEVLQTHPAVAECAVIGVADPEWGETPVAYVVRAPGSAVAAEELDELCLANLARYKRPRRYLFIEELPKSFYGKILKTALRETAPEGGAQLTG
jgi:long-chain acyl-CoA synthetase